MEHYIAKKYLTEVSGPLSEYHILCSIINCLDSWFIKRF